MGIEPQQVPPHPVLSDYYRSDGERQAFLNAMFDKTASYYKTIDRAAGFGSGTWYRRNALRAAGLKPEMRVLDVACGPGLVTACAREVVGATGLVVGLDPSAGMLREAQRTGCGFLVRGVGEKLPFANASYDFLSMGYALRHVPDLGAAFREYARVLKSQGIVLILELARPASRALNAIAKFYIREVLSRVFYGVSRDPALQTALQYWWDTTEHCVAPDEILRLLNEAGFADCTTTERMGGTLREYRAVKA